MNNLKFRVWDIPKNKYFYNGSGFVLDLSGRLWGIVEQEVFYVTNQKDFVIEQFTGLKDKNGKDIYEGDIIKPGHLCMLHKYEILVEYESEYAGFSPFTNKKNGEYCGSEFDSPNIEIIGNIHENPEFLTECQKT